MAEDRRAARAHRPAQPQGQLLAGRPDRSVRPVQRALPRPRTRVRVRRRPPGRRERALPGVLEPRVHAVRPEPGGDAHAAPRQQHRHRAGTEPPRGDHAGHDVGLRDRPDPPAHRPRRGAQRQALRRDVRDRPCAAHPRGPHARDELPGGRRRGPLQRGSRLRAAPPHAARGRPGAADRHRAGLPGALRGGRARADGRRVSRAPGASRGRPDVALSRGGRVQPHARAGHAAARRHRGAGQGRGRGGHRRRPGVPPARHVRLPVRPHARARGRAGPGRRRVGLRGRSWASSASGPAMPAAAARDDDRGRIAAFAESSEATTFTGYETTRAGDRGGGHRARGRPRPGQARRVAVLRDGRRPGRTTTA